MRASKVSSAKGRHSPRPSTTWTWCARPARATLPCPWRIMASVRSTPTTCAPVRCASCRATPAGAGGHVEDRRPGFRRHHVVDHGPAPAAVLAHRQELRQPVVALGQPVEQAAGEPAVAGAGRQCLSAHGATIPQNAPRWERKRWTASISTWRWWDRVPPAVSPRSSWPGGSPGGADRQGRASPGTRPVATPSGPGPWRCWHELGLVLDPRHHQARRHDGGGPLGEAPAPALLRGAHLPRLRRRRPAPRLRHLVGRQRGGSRGRGRDGACPGRRHRRRAGRGPDRRARRRRDDPSRRGHRRRRRHQPCGRVRRAGRSPSRPVGIRRARLPRRHHRPPAHRAVGAQTEARLPRLRLALPRARRTASTPVSASARCRTGGPGSGRSGSCPPSWTTSGTWGCARMAPRRPSSTDSGGG